MVYHVPAMLDESINGLDIRPNGIYVDVTFGGGGHSREILRKLGNGKLIAFDQDEDAEVNLPDDERFTFLNQNFRFLKNNLRHIGISSVDGIIADLGVSFHQFDVPERGFSFRHESMLDMRMNRDSSVTAAGLLASLSEEELADIMYRYGELTNARQIGRLITEARNVAAIETTGDLKRILGPVTPRRNENKFFARVYQALRIAVNNEIDNLKDMLGQSLEVLRQNGRLVVITYHSLEDRVVKNFMKTGNFEGEVEKDFYGNVSTPFLVINRKGTCPADDEIADNPRARSARLRIAERILV